MKRPAFAWLMLLAVLLVVSAGGVAAAERCTVADPSGTPLNVRANPEGRVTGALANGRVLSVADTIRDGRGRSWSLAYDFWTGDKLGWVFRANLSCP